VGLSTLNNTQARTPDALLGEADRALYDIKRARKSSREDGETLNAHAAGVQSPPLSRRAG
jgi:hypothetical protein